MSLGNYSGPFAEGSRAGALQPQKSTLSGIPEQLVVNSKLYLVLVGPNAWSKSEAFCKKVSEEFFTETFDKMHGFRAWQSRKRTSSSNVNYLTDHPPMSCTVLVKSEDPFTPLAERVASPANSENSMRGGKEPAWGMKNSQKSARSYQQRNSYSIPQTPKGTSLRRSFLDITGLNSIRGRRNSSSGWAPKSSFNGNEMDLIAGHQAVKVCCFPVEHFSETVPMCKSVDQWRALCMVFLLDPRQTDDGDVVKELSSRLEEVRRWVGNFIQASDIKSAPAQLQVVLQHDSSGGLDARPTERELAFTEKVRDVSQSPETATIHHFCDFDDTQAFMHRLVEVLTSAIDNRQGDDYDFQPEFLEMLAQRQQEVDSEERRPKECCAAM